MCRSREYGESGTRRRRNSLVFIQYDEVDPILFEDVGQCQASDTAAHDEHSEGALWSTGFIVVGGEIGGERSAHWLTPDPRAV